MEHLDSNSFTYKNGMRQIRSYFKLNSSILQHTIRQDIKSNNNKYYVKINSTNLQIIRPTKMGDNMIQKEYKLWIILASLY